MECLGASDAVSLSASAGSIMFVATDIVLRFADSGGKVFEVLDLPHFAPGEGKLTVVSGASGSGKSTLLYVMAGLLPPQKGTVRFSDTDLYALSEHARDGWRRTKMGFIFQDFHLIPEMSPIANVTLPGTFGRGGGLRRRANELLAELGVPTQRRSIDLLSRGERQRVAIARALVFDPPVILADEPTASLDREATMDFLALVDRLVEDGRTVVIASHDPDVLQRANAEFRLERGRLLESINRVPG